MALLRHCERLCCIEAFVRQTRFASWGAVRIHRRLDRCRNESHSLDSTPVARFGPTFSVTQLSLRRQDVGTPDPESFKKAINLADRDGEVAYDEFAVS